MRKGIAIAGNLIVDTVKVIDTYPENGMLATITDVDHGVGGCSTNTIIQLAKIDESMDLFACGMIGDDGNGQYVVDMLAKHGVNTDGVKVNKDEVTSFTDVMNAADDKSRTFFHARGANAVFGIGDIDFENMNAKFFHIGYALLLDAFDAPDEQFGTVMARALFTAKQKGMVTSMDVVSENSDRFAKIVTPSLKYCDNLIINEVEASMTCGLPVRKDGELDEALLKIVCESLLSKGVGKLVVIHAPEAACAMDKGGKFTFTPSLKLPKGFIKGSVGAGDAFCAGMLYSLYKQFDIEFALLFSAGAAACNLSEFNSTDGMKNVEGIKDVIALYKRS
ncbi:MAG: carbohydrate kinase family protein [Clostridia bacterium]|mgnify:CR=1 FL=1|jgi:sugar/nucleoside kinase (ribokinase family)|nr:carbohydrate kinase family protein [Clostridia bacterium]MBT7122475.1 carbohydrate kinase family protein [Clostridia bacterium]